MTTGLLRTMPKRELEAVLAHEIAHVRNRDTYLMTMAAVFVGVIALIADIGFRSLAWGGGRRKGGVIVIVAAVIGFLLALPAGFQRSEFLFEHGFIDRVVARPELRDELVALLRLLPARAEPIPGTSADLDIETPGFRPFSFLSSLAERVGERTNGDAPPAAPAGLPSDSDPRDDVWARVQLARNLARPRTLEFVEAMTDGFVELHGDRLFGDDAAMVVGLARLDGRRVAIVGQQKGADTDENIRRNFGMPHPEGYRKAMRIMEMAERFGLPVITFVDVPGAHPGPESEERGIAEAIARSIGLMSRLRTPIVTVITGEGGSGGALAIAVGDVVIAFENAVYSVISPGGLRRDPVADRG